MIPMRVPTRVPLKISQGSPRREAFDLPRRPLWNARRGIWVLAFGFWGLGFRALVLGFWLFGVQEPQKPEMIDSRTGTDRSSILNG